MQYYSYVYRISTPQLCKQHYYGSRYCMMTNRYSTDPLQDLKIYQSSSTDKQFKRYIKENFNSTDKIKFKIIKVCETASQALSLESNLHAKFDVANHELFYNKHNQGNKKYLNYDIFDLMTNTIRKVKDILSMVDIEYSDIIHVFYKPDSVISERFCNIQSDKLQQHKQNYYNKYIKTKLLYSPYNNFLGKSYTQHELVKSYHANHNSVRQLFNENQTPKRNTVESFYTSKEEAISDYEITTVKKYNKQGEYTTLNIYKKDMSKIYDGLYYKLEKFGYYNEYTVNAIYADKCINYIRHNHKISPKFKYINGVKHIKLYYYNKQYGMRFSYYTFDQLKDIIGNKRSDIWNARRLNSNGYYILYSQIQKEYKQYKFYTVVNNKIKQLTVFYIDLVKLFDNNVTNILKQIQQGIFKFYKNIYLDYEYAKSQLVVY